MKKPQHVIFDIGGMNGARTAKIENAFIAFALKSQPYVICHSKIIIENYLTTYKSLLPRTQFIPFGVNTDEFQPVPNIEEYDYVFSFGYAKRDYDTLLKAWKMLNNNSIKLRIAGISQFAASGGCTNIEFLGKISTTQLKNEIQASKFVVIPLPVFNYSYGQMSFLQSMSLGKTVIVTNTPSSTDYIEDGNGAFLVKPYDVEDMKNKIEFLLNHNDILMESNYKARRYVIENFNEERMGRNIYRMISKLFETPL